MSNATGLELANLIGDIDVRNGGHGGGAKDGGEELHIVGGNTYTG